MTFENVGSVENTEVDSRFKLNISLEEWCLQQRHLQGVCMIQVVQYTCTSTRVFLEPEISKCLCMCI
jgi:hypothetical protein